MLLLLYSVNRRSWGKLNLNSEVRLVGVSVVRSIWRRNTAAFSIDSSFLPRGLLFDHAVHGFSRTRFSIQGDARSNPSSYIYASSYVIFELDMRIALSTSMINVVCCLYKMADSGIKFNREKYSNTIFDLTVHA